MGNRCTNLLKATETGIDPAGLGLLVSTGVTDEKGQASDPGVEVTEEGVSAARTAEIGIIVRTEVTAIEAAMRRRARSIRKTRSTKRTKRGPRGLLKRKRLGKCKLDWPRLDF